MTQSTCRVSDNVTVQILMPFCEAEHMTPVSAACAVVDGLAALPHPASAAQRARVMVVSVAQMVFLIVRSFDGGWRGGSRGGWLF